MREFNAGSVQGRRDLQKYRFMQALHREACATQRTEMPNSMATWPVQGREQTSAPGFSLPTWSPFKGPTAVVWLSAFPF